MQLTLNEILYGKKASFILPALILVCTIVGLLQNDAMLLLFALVSAVVLLAAVRTIQPKNQSEIEQEKQKKKNVVYGKRCSNCKLFFEGLETLFNVTECSSCGGTLVWEMLDAKKAALEQPIPKPVQPDTTIPETQQEPIQTEPTPRVDFLQCPPVPEIPTIKPTKKRHRRKRKRKATPKEVVDPIAFREPDEPQPMAMQIPDNPIQDEMPEMPQANE